MGKIRYYGRRNEVEDPRANFSADVDGTTVHARAVQAAAAGPKFADVDVAFSSTAFNGGELKTQITNEVNELAAPVVPAKNVPARAGLVVGIGEEFPQVDGRPSS